MPCRFLAIACLLVAPSLASADWPGWRGPDANAVAPPGDYPAAFGPETNLLWEVDLPGVGASTPVVWGDKIFLTASAEERDLLLCFDLAGKELWRKDIGKSAGAKHRSGTGSNPSCAVDAEHVVAYFKSGALACFTHDGKELWNVNLQDVYGKNTLWWDLGTSPVLSSHGVVVAVIQEGDSYVVTLDLETGQEVWKQDRNYERPRESDQAYTTPSVVQTDGKETIVTWGADHLTGHDAATGALIWQRDGFNPDNQGMWRVIASATIVDGVAYVPYGRADFFRAVRLGNLEEDPAALVWELIRRRFRHHLPHRTQWQGLHPGGHRHGELPRRGQRPRAVEREAPPQPHQVLQLAAAGGRLAVLPPRGWRRVCGLGGRWLAGRQERPGRRNSRHPRSSGWDPADPHPREAV